jgi:hypothetical protein
MFLSNPRGILFQDVLPAISFVRQDDAESATGSPSEKSFPVLQSNTHLWRTMEKGRERYDPAVALMTEETYAHPHKSMRKGGFYLICLTTNMLRQNGRF